MVSQVTLGKQLARGDFKFVYVAGTNPALCYPDQGAIRQGLSRPDIFVVTHDPHWNETADYADIVLPAQTFLEKDGCDRTVGPLAYPEIDGGHRPGGPKPSRNRGDDKH